MVAITKTDPFAYLVTMAEANPAGGPALAALHASKHVNNAATFFLKDPVGFAAFELKLRWPGKAAWVKGVKAHAKRAVVDRIKEKKDEQLEAVLASAREARVPVLDKGRPVDAAKAFKQAKRRHLVFCGGQWLAYEGTRWVEVEGNGIRADVQHFMDGAVDLNTGDAFIIAPREVDHVVDALRSECFMEAGTHLPPCWIDGEFEAPARFIVAAKNGLLNTVSHRLTPHTPRFFNRNALDFNYVSDAPPPVVLLAFLESIWPEHGVSPKEAAANRQSKATLQEIMGHLLTGETKYQKIFLLLGASRGGKGVVTRLATKLLGTANVVSLSAAKLGAPFGLKSLIGKQLMVVPDFRLGRGTQNTTLITERLLSISGEDAMSVDRKFMDDWEGKLGTRILLASNLAITFPDQAGALLNRLIVLVFTKSFADNPDLTLEDRLEAELPSILLWALEGLRRLEDRVDAHGRPLGFIIPPTGEAVLQGIARQGSTVKAFLDEMCVLDRDERVEKVVLYAAFDEWLQDNDLDEHYDEGMFSKELFAASGYSVTPKRLRVSGAQVQHYAGVALAD